MSNNIVLIGFMGVGKGTVARELCKKLKRLMLDTDDLIESSENLKIREIFETKGEEYFRKQESLVAKNLAANVQNCVIAGGGGFVNVKNLNKIGTVIYLKSSFDGIIKRIENSQNAQKKFAKRPLLKDRDKAKELFKTRKKIYEKKADIIVDVEGKSAKNIVKEIVNKIKK
ncbi:shikimate kinase [Campylobacter sp. RM16192]|uniref:shikimate kinase n=1 Tax=Campylobacter sp. RM16192 TaxID=1660080 RepID=UPI0014518FFA|nr:shikimate kinase [Campylobacter sp. RM16192]QCD52106.1 shikimate kinase [Campylobacter sp. RM16192]